MALTYVSHERINLKKSPEFNEAWLQSRIADDPTILGLGDVDLLERERTSGQAGRLDLLLSNIDENRRYEVELMLGPTDPSHIIRTIEYWDIEKRRFPAYDHVAVIVAEDITARFLNVLALFAGTIPLIAIQVNALQVGDNIVLDFVTVLNQTELREDDTEEATSKEPVNREYWEKKSTPKMLALMDRAFEMLHKHAPEYSLNYNRKSVVLTDGARSRNFVVFRPTKGHLRLAFAIADQTEWARRLEELGFSPRKLKKLWINVTESSLNEFSRELDELFATAASEAR